MTRYAAFHRSLALSVIVLASCTAQDESGAESDSAVAVSRDVRDRAARGAQIWSKEEWLKIREKDFARGQDFDGAPRPGEEVVCKFKELETAEDKPNGKSPKFTCGPCELTPEEIYQGKKPCTVKNEIKVKYSGKGRPVAETNPATLAGWASEDAKVNGEVFTEVVGTRLLWALGFFADGVYPAKVTCYGCPEKPWETYKAFPRATDDVRADRRFEFGAVEIKIDGKKIENKPDSGFDWKDDAPKIVPRADREADGAATKEEVDAWRLLAAFMVHADNKAENQRLFCAPGKMHEDGTCEQPRAMIQDIGLSFGTEGMWFGIGFDKGRLGGWKEWDLWRRPQDRERDGGGALGAGQCQARLETIVSLSNHPLRHPIISEQGRETLATMMSPLTDDMLRTIFTVSRIAERGETIDGRPVTVDDWIREFNARRAEVENGCPQQHR